MNIKKKYDTIARVYCTLINDIVHKNRKKTKKYIQMYYMLMHILDKSSTIISKLNQTQGCQQNIY